MPAEGRVREEVLAAAKGLKARQLTAGRSGNESARLHDGFVITPSGLPYDAMGAEDLVWIDALGQPDPDALLPSSEWQLHKEIYRARPEVGAIVHAHPRSATALACARRDIPAFHYMVAVAGGRNIRCAPYATFGTLELARLAVDALKDRRACLLANHGTITVHATAAAALELTEEVEWLAGQYLAALAAGPVTILWDAEMERVLEKFRTYGQQPGPTARSRS